LSTTADEFQVAAAYAEHGDAVLRMASRFCRPMMAEDVAQEVFLYLWGHPDQFDAARGTLGAFLLTITRNRAIDAARSESSRSSREQRDGMRPRRLEVLVESIVIDNDRAATMARALAGLPGTEREAISIAFYQDCSYRQAAQVLGLPEGTTKSRIRAGLKRLAVSPEVSPEAQAS
jgi:RNA polymerase sigma-70 factor (ECF subfamily)